MPAGKIRTPKSCVPRGKQSWPANRAGVGRRGTGGEDPNLLVSPCIGYWLACGVGNTSSWEEPHPVFLNPELHIIPSGVGDSLDFLRPKEYNFYMYRLVHHIHTIAFRPRIHLLT